MHVGLPNLWLTPHIAGLSADSNLRVSALIAQKVGATLIATAAPFPHDGLLASGTTDTVPAITRLEVFPGTSRNGYSRR